MLRSNARRALVLVLALAAALVTATTPSAAPQTPAQPIRHDRAPKPSKQHPASELATLKPPPTWLVRSDATGGADEGIYFVSMPPGWHITTGAGVTLHDPATRAEGGYRVESTIFLFPAKAAEGGAAGGKPSVAAAGESGYGLLIGGRDLEAASRRYTAILLRRDGQFAIVSQRGDTRTLALPWRAHPAIVPHTDPTDGAKPVKNVLSVDVGTTELIVRANGQELGRLPRGDLDLDGRVGLRVDRDVNLHVTNLDVSRPAAPAAAR